MRGSSTDTALTIYAYYGDSETRANPCVSGSPSVNQGGMAKLTTSPTLVAGSARVEQQVYDASGRTVPTNTPEPCPSCRWAPAPTAPRWVGFLSVDPVDGGSANADPINATDLDGNWPSWMKKIGHAIGRGVRAVGRAAAWTGRTIWRNRSTILTGLAVAGMVAGTGGVGAALFGASMLLGAADTINSCVRRDKMGCGLGVVGLLTGGAGYMYGRLARTFTQFARSGPRLLRPLNRFASRVARGVSNLGNGVSLGTAIPGHTTSAADTADTVSRNGDRSEYGHGTSAYCR